MKKTFRHLAVLALLTGIAVSARAGTYDFSYHGNFGTNTVIGSFTTNPKALSGGGHRITSISGTFDAASITGLVGRNGFAGNDNLFYPNYANGADFYSPFDASGVSFKAGGQFINLFSDAGLEFGMRDCVSANTCTSSAGTLTISPASTAVPEPASLALLGTGLIGLGLVLRRRQAA